MITFTAQIRPTPPTQPYPWEWRLIVATPEDPEMLLDHGFASTENEAELYATQTLDQWHAANAAESWVTVKTTEFEPPTEALYLIRPDISEQE